MYDNGVMPERFEPIKNDRAWVSSNWLAGLLKSSGSLDIEYDFPEPGGIVTDAGSQKTILELFPQL